MIFSLIAGFVLGVGALVFASQNTQFVALTFLGWQFQSSLALLVIVSVGFGIVLSILATLPTAVSNHFRMRGLRKQNQNLVAEVEAQRQAQAAAAPAEEITEREVDLHQ
ncbi:MAG: hypothetical protein JWN18_69 [Parcubacteria group bacterium]|nr:hypothetical protein [Parcubacteria group bacterium]